MGGGVTDKKGGPGKGGVTPMPPEEVVLSYPGPTRAGCSRCAAPGPMRV